MGFPGYTSILGLRDNTAREHNYSVTRLFKERHVEIVQWSWL